MPIPTLLSHQPIDFCNFHHGGVSHAHWKFSSHTYYTFLGTRNLSTSWDIQILALTYKSTCVYPPPPSQKHGCICLLHPPLLSFAHRSGQLHQRPSQENETNTSARHLDTDKHAYMPNGWNKKPKYKSVLTKMLQPNFTNATLLRFKCLLQKRLEAQMLQTSSQVPHA